MTIPKKEITLLDTDGKKKREKSLYEIFSIMVDDENGTPLENPFDGTDYDIDFTYHARTFGETKTIGWILIENSSSDESDTYIFGYNQKLSPKEETVTLFDKVKLKNFINGEITGEVTIDVRPYAIQADSLKANGLTSTYLDNVTKNDLKIIFAVIERKAGNT